MFRFLSIFVLVFTVSILNAADPQIDAIMKSYDEATTKLKADTIKKLKDILDKKMTAKDLDGANNAKKAIALVEGKNEEEKVEDDKTNDKDQLAVLAETSLPKGAKLYKVSASSYEGTEIGKFKKGDKIEISYVSGEWAGRVKVVNPNKEENAYAKCILFNIDKKGTQNLITSIPMNTDKQPYQYKFDSNVGSVFLRISCGGLNDKNSLAGCIGETSYWVRKAK